MSWLLRVAHDTHSTTRELLQHHLSLHKTHFPDLTQNIGWYIPLRNVRLWLCFLRLIYILCILFSLLLVYSFVPPSTWQKDLFRSKFLVNKIFLKLTFFKIKHLSLISPTKKEEKPKLGQRQTSDINNASAGIWFVLWPSLKHRCKPCSWSFSRKPIEFC